MFPDPSVRSTDQFEAIGGARLLPRKKPTGKALAALALVLAAAANEVK